MSERSHEQYRQLHSQGGYELLGQICPEIESCPRIFTCKTSQGHRVESMFYLAMGTDSLSYFIMDPLYETPEWYGSELLEPLAKESPCYRSCIRHNEGTLPGGVGLCAPMKSIANRVEDLGLPLIGVPFAGYSPYAVCRQITGNAAEKLSEEELRSALQGNVLLNGEAVKIIAGRGLSPLIGGVSAEKQNETALEFYTDDPLNGELSGARNFTLSSQRYVFEAPDDPSCRILSRYKNARGKDFGPASLCIRRADGTRAVLIGYDGFNSTYLSTSRVRFLNRMADWCAHEKLPALSADPVQCLIVPRVTPDGTLRSVFVLNVTIGRQKPFVLKLRNLPENLSVAEWLVPSEQPVRLDLRVNGAGAEVTILGLNAWNIGWLKIY